MIDELRGEIERLRAQTRPLEPDSNQRRELGEQVLNHALNFLDQVEDAPSLRPASVCLSFAQSGISGVKPSSNNRRPMEPAK